MTEYIILVVKLFLLSVHQIIYVLTGTRNDTRALDKATSLHESQRNLGVVFMTHEMVHFLTTET